MNFMLWQRQNPIAIATDRRVLTAQEVPVLEQANGLCDRLNQMVSAQPAKEQAAVQAAREQAYEQGLLAGQQAARDQLADALTTMSRDLADAREQMRAEMATLSLAVVHKIMGQFADDVALAGLAATAAAQAMQQSQTSQSLTLTVHSDQAENVRARLAQWMPDDEITQLSVVADPDCAADTCRLDSDLGSIDASLPVQLDRLAKAWGQRNSEATTVHED